MDTLLSAALALLIPATFAAMVGCADDVDSMGEYYEFTFVDTVSAVPDGDTVHVVVIERPLPSNLQTIPYTVTDAAGMGDTTRVILTVLYGGYSPTPTPHKIAQTSADSIILRYDYAGSLAKHTATDVSNRMETSPRITFYSIRHVELQHPSTRQTTFRSLHINSRP